MSKGTEHKAQYTSGFIFWMVLANAIGMMAMDIHLPSLPEITNDLNTNYFMAQSLIVIFYIVGIFARFFIGSLSDVYGRIKILKLAFDIQILGLVVQSLANNIEVLILGRALQGFASGGLIIIINALITEQYKGDEKINMLSFNEYMQPVSFLLAPIVGAYLASYYGWRSGFIFLLVNMIFGRAILTFYLFKLKPIEHSSKKPFKLSKSFKIYGKLLGNRKFLLNSLIMAFLVSGYAVYLISSSYIYLDHFGLSKKQFAILQTLPLFLQTIIVLFYKNSQISYAFLQGLGMFMVNLVVILSSALLFGFIQFEPLILLLLVILICISIVMIFPVSLKSALDSSPPKYRGTASSAVVFIRSIFMGLAMTLSSLLYNNFRMLMGLIMACFIIIIILWLMNLEAERSNKMKKSLIK